MSSGSRHGAYIDKHCFIAVCKGKLLGGKNAPSHFKAHSEKNEGVKNEENVKNCAPQENGETCLSCLTLPPTQGKSTFYGHTTAKNGDFQFLKMVADLHQW